MTQSYKISQPITLPKGRTCHEYSCRISHQQCHLLSYCRTFFEPLALLRNICIPWQAHKGHFGDLTKHLFSKLRRAAHEGKVTEECQRMLARETDPMVRRLLQAMQTEAQQGPLFDFLKLVKDECPSVFGFCFPVILTG